MDETANSFSRRRLGTQALTYVQRASGTCTSVAGGRSATTKEECAEGASVIVRSTYFLRYLR